MNKEEKKAIGKKYVQTHRPMGIFQIKNQINGKIFVGSSMDLSRAYNRHAFSLNMRSHMNKEWQKEWVLHGEEQFSFEVLEQIKPREEVILSPDDLRKYKDELKRLEKKWLEKLQPYEERGYNKRSTRQSSY